MKNFLLLSLLLLSLSPPSTTAIQTPTQKNVTQQAYQEAVPASEQATPQLLSLFSHPSTYYYLRQFDDGSHLYTLPPTTLLTNFWQQISITELVHNFGDGASSSANCGFDLSIPQATHTPLFPNQWQLQSAGAVPVDPTNNWFTEWSETNIFHYPPFSNVSSPDMKTSTSRPIYAALNMYKGSGGNPQCGRVAAVYDWKYLGGNVLGAPLDTGFFTGSCNQGQTVGSLGNTTMGICSAWPLPRPLGSPPYLHHLLHPYLYFYNQSQEVAGEDYPYYNLARLIIRLLSPETYKIPLRKELEKKGGKGGESGEREGESPQALSLNFVENLLGYFEINPSMPIFYPKGVKFMIGMFELIWGTTEGEQLREWCIKQGWPLLWAHNPTMSYFRCGASGDAPGCSFPPSLIEGGDKANTRILDLYVIDKVPAGHNVTVGEEERGVWEEVWRGGGGEGERGGERGREEGEREWGGLWEVFGEGWGVEPLFWGGCEGEGCVGVFVGSGECVCSP